jgi:hypothetical protein
MQLLHIPGMLVSMLVSQICVGQAGLLLRVITHCLLPVMLKNFVHCRSEVYLRDTLFWQLVPSVDARTSTVADYTPDVTSDLHCPMRWSISVRQIWKQNVQMWNAPTTALQRYVILLAARTFKRWTHWLPVLWTDSATCQSYGMSSVPLYVQMLLRCKESVYCSLKTMKRWKHAVQLHVQICFCFRCRKFGVTQCSGFILLIPFVWSQFLS